MCSGVRGGLQQDLSLAKADGEVKKASKLVDDELEVMLLVCQEGTIIGAGKECS